MNISPLEEYALRCAVQLARLDNETHLSASKIAETEGISVEYASKIMFLFRQAGLVQSVRGLRGGFKLSRPAAEITLKSIFDALPVAKRIDSDFCEQYGGQKPECVHLGCCSIRPFWTMLSSFFDEVSGAVNLEDLVDPEAKVQRRLHHLTHSTVAAFKQGRVQ
ncbi:MAG: Rrf2 family transcriptional regulator [Bdellovibrionaceae bacterium]|nr:Rrf2 family transcriptional regulator [Pseudobdellovibrionaceae bacterium]